MKRKYILVALFTVAILFYLPSVVKAVPPVDPLIKIVQNIWEGVQSLQADVTSIKTGLENHTVTETGYDMVAVPFSGENSEMEIIKRQFPGAAHVSLTVYLQNRDDFVDEQQQVHRDAAWVSVNFGDRENQGYANLSLGFGAGNTVEFDTYYQWTLYAGNYVEGTGEDLDVYYNYTITYVKQ